MRFSLVLVLEVALSEGADVQPSCGRVSGSVGGQDIPTGRWPWFAGFYFQSLLFCSGSLITDQWLLSGLKIFLLFFLSVFLCLFESGQFNFRKHVMENGLDNNICLVKLSSPVELSDHISPVCLAAENSTFPNGTFSWITGNNLGDAHEEIMELQPHIWGDNECQHSQFTITDNKICTRNDPPMKQPCFVFFGAPLLIINDDLVWIQFGVSLSSLMCRKERYPPVSTRVSRYQDWIRSVTGSSQLGFVTFSSSGDDGVSASTSSP
uniref:Peptidase S1 domain-containing protein n=1 Tax=Tetraodon nigroviridis TaxID=99883 RepID=H3C2P7_TETNG